MNDEDAPEYPLKFQTPHLEHLVELSEERAQHIAERHRDLWLERQERSSEVLRDLDWIQTDARDQRVNKRIFVRHISTRWLW